jgi:hypothetical protein
LRTLRIFVSSPRDVGSERALAARTLDRLRFEFRGVCDLRPIFWEQMPMRATDTFQAQIPQAGEADICVFILWSWFGTPLPESFRRSDGSRYLSGTEFEFESAFTSHQSRGSPDILVYRKTTELRAAIHSREQVMERLAQRDAVQGFIERYFRGEGGSFRAAFREFDAPVDFEEMLETHLRELIRGHLADETGASAGAAAALWTQSPFRGLEIFDVEHALIYCGRTRAVTEVIETLRRRAEAGQPLVLVIGTSGSGKSSLVRAGIVPMLTQPRVVEEAVAWRHAVLRPGDAGAGGPLASLAAALLAEGALPELAAGGTTARSLAEVLRDKPAALAPLLALTLERVAEHARQATPELDPAGVARLVLVLDQLEEIFAPAIGTAEQRSFAAAVAALAASGRVWVLATLRSDFYPRCGELPDAFGDLIRGDGTYELRPPRPAEIAQMIRRPALVAGLSFERSAETEEGLDDVLRDAAAANPAALPLLQFALDELYKRREGNVLRFADYAALGGLEGALRRRAEEEYERLAEPARKALPAVLSGLVRIELEDDAVAARRVPRATLAAAAGALDLADAFVRARLFVADRSEGEGATVGVAHEALLREWPRARSWIEENKALLRTQARVAAAAMLWREGGRDEARLLPAGRALGEARALLAEGGAGLSPATAEFIAASRRYAAHLQRRRRWRSGAVAAVLLAAVAAAGAYYEAYRAPVVAYYGYFLKRFGTYEGLAPQLSTQAVRHRTGSLEFTTAGRFGRTTDLQIVNGHGACPQNFPIETYLGFMNRNALGAPQLCRDELIYSGGRIASEIAFDRNGRRLWSFIYTDAARTTAEFHSRSGSTSSMSQSGASTVRITRIAHGRLRGLERSVKFFDAYGRPQPDSEGRYGEAFHYDARGYPTRITALGQDGRPTLPRNDVAITEAHYDSRGNETKVSYFDERGQPMRNPQTGAAAQEGKYDRYGNLVALTLLDQRGRPTRGGEGWAQWKRVVNDRGDVVAVSYFDRYGRPVNITAGYARLTHRFDSRGRVVEEDYFAANGAPIAAKGGAERIRMTYDARGNVARIAYFDHDGHPVVLPQGYSRIAKTYDDNGFLVGASYLDKDGNLIDTKSGIAQIRTTVDGAGEPVDTVFLDRNGRRVRGAGGYAEVRRTYDVRGNVVSTAFFDENGKPVVSRAGWAREIQKWDDRGNVVEDDYFDAGGRPAPIGVGDSIVKMIYDRRSNRIETRYFAAPGQSLDPHKGCPVIRLAYDDLRRAIEWTCRDAGGRLMRSPRLGYARRTDGFDSHGNLNEIAYFDEHDRPLRVAGLGYARVKLVFDGDHDITDIRFSDADGKPIAPPKFGCAHIALSYDKGRRTSRRCLDPAARPAPASGAPKG